ncbi:hypothetical protein DESUT3_31070 [Desulfuromonas versatilis]|uniref:Uncharacterized protein n=1 Tax=Desulfuromonas versatilis TaxID=2802975 RepID=A0ABN6E104_9BACT|nr:hypothetical protein [Desulfuromonas versatilis]BCR06038.1 hypothetical protein DESUT3_31070 [Desulfuromonas versatilis]
MKEPRHISDGHVYASGQDLKLLQLFTYSALVSMLLILLLIGSGIYLVFSRHIVRSAEDDAVKIGQALVQEHLGAFIHGEGAAPLPLEIPERGLAEFDRKIRHSLVLYNIPKIKIYAPDQRILYSTDGSIIGQADLENSHLKEALGGQVSSRLEKGEELWDLNLEQRIAGDMVETYLPVLDALGRSIGVFEIYLDVSAYRAEMKRVVASAIVIVALTLGVVFGVLLLLMRRATRLVYSQSQQLKVLSGLLPICSACKKIRNGAGDWEILEKYITERSESAFTHSLCPDCLKQYWPD